LAKKKVTKKKAAKKTARKSTSKKSSRTSSAKKTAKKAPAKKTSTKRKSTASKKVTKKKVTKKVVKKKAVKKAAKKATTKKVAKKKAKAAPKKKVARKSTAKKTSETPASKDSSKSVPSPKADSGTKASTEQKSDSAQKKKRSSKAKKPEFKVPVRPLLLGPNGPAIKPLIPSGKDNKLVASVLDNVTSRRTKTPLTKAQLENYRQILIQKRAELLGDMQNLEQEALRSDSGRSSHTAQHLDEAGSDSYEQSLNLNLAASDRERINEIDAALQRIKDRTYGLCELTFEPIKKARLDEIPWTRYTIEAARELDRRGGHR
jgi:RNA polymerase-binding transcription factor DksA